jgi:hypothetical protein
MASFDDNQWSRLSGWKKKFDALTSNPFEKRMEELEAGTATPSSMDEDQWGKIGSAAKAVDSLNPFAKRMHEMAGAEDAANAAKPSPIKTGDVGGMSVEKPAEPQMSPLPAGYKPPDPAPAPPARGGGLKVGTSAKLDLDEGKPEERVMAARPDSKPSFMAPIEQHKPGAAPPLKDEEMEKAQAESRSKQMWSALPRFLAGFTDDSDGINKMLTEATGKPVADLLAKRGELRKLAEDRDREEQRQKRLSLDDPNSRESQMAAKLGLANGMLKPGQEVGFTANMWQLMKDGASYAQAKEHQQALEKQAANQLAETSRHSKVMESQGWANIANDKAKIAAAGAGGGPKNTAELIAVPGTPVGEGPDGEVYDLGDVPIKGNEAAEFRTSLAKIGELKKAAREIQKIVKEHGTEAWGPLSGRLAALQSKLQLTDKDIERLGAVSGVDMGFLTNQIPRFDTWTPDTFGTREAQLSQFVNSVDNTLEGAVKSKRLVRRGGGAPAAAAPGGQQVVKYKTSPDGKRRVPVYADGSYGPEEAI